MFFVVATRFSFSSRASGENYALKLYSNNSGWANLQTWHFNCDVVSFPLGCVGIGTGTPGAKFHTICAAGVDQEGVDLG